MKTCTKCHVEKDESSFRPRPNRPSGIRSWCKECEAADSRRYRSDNPEKWAETKSRYREANREKEADAAREYRRRFPEKISAYNKKYRRENPEKVAAIMLAWQRAHPEYVREFEALRRAKMNGVRINRAYVYERDGGVCHICETRVPRESFTLDHLIPLAHNGPHTYENVRVAHARCNSSMGAARRPAQLLLVG